MIEFRIYLRGGGVIGPYVVKGEVLDALQDEWLLWFEDQVDGTDGVSAPSKNAIYPFAVNDLVGQAAYSIEVILGEIAAIVVGEVKS